MNGTDAVTLVAFLIAAGGLVGLPTVGVIKSVRH